MAEKVDIIDIDLSKLKKEAKDASNSIEDLNDNLKETEKVSDKLGKSLKDASGNIKDLEDSAEAASDKTEILLTGMEHTTNIAAGMVGSVQAVEGALQLMGIESEEVTQAIQKMQAIMAITDGLRAMAEAAKSFKELRALVLANTAATTADTTATVADTAAKGALATATGGATAATNKLTKAMLKNPWTAIAVAILAAATAIGTWVKSASKAERAQKRIAKANEAVKKSIEENTTAYEREAAFMEARGENQRDILEYKRAEAKINYELAESQKNKVLADKNATKEAKDNALAMVDAAWQALMGINDAITIFELNTQREARQAAAEAARERKESAAEAARERKTQISDAHTDYVTELKNLNEELYQMSLTSTSQQGRQLGLQYKEMKDKYRKMLEDNLISQEEYYVISSKINKVFQNKNYELIKQRLADEHELRRQNVRSQEEFYWATAQYNKNIRETDFEEYSRSMDVKMNKMDLFNQGVSAAQIGVKKFTVLYNSMFHDITKVTSDYSKLFPKDSKFADEIDVKMKAYGRLISEAKKKYIEAGMGKDEALVEANKQYGLKAIDSIRDEFVVLWDSLIDEAEVKNKEIQAEMMNAIPDQAKIDALTADRDDILAEISKYQTAVADLDNYKLQIADLQNQIDAFTQEETLAKLSEVSELLQGASDSFQELNAIGGGVSDQWGAVFDSMTAGLDRVQHAVEKGGKGWSKYGAMASAGLHVASSMLMAIADEQNESTEEGFEKQKKLQIAAASMAMMGGIIDAWTSAMNPANAWMTIWGQVAAGAATSAMILATGIMQINAIKRQKMDGSGGEGGAVANPALSALTNLGSGVSATTEIEGASTEGKVQDTRVYVVESDITSSQNNVKTSVDEATY